MTTYDYTEMEALTRKVMTDKTPWTLMIPVMDAWLVVSMLQLASRNSSLHENTLQQFEYIGRQFQRAITDVHPESNRVIEMCWHPEYAPNESQMRDTIKATVSDTALIKNLILQIRDVWLLVSALQLVSRHPSMTEKWIKWLEEIGRQFQSVIAHRHPDANNLLEMGWHPEYDQPK